MILDLGRIPDHALVKLTVPVENPSPEPARIEDILESCGCILSSGLPLEVDGRTQRLLLIHARTEPGDTVFSQAIGLVAPGSALDGRRIGLYAEVIPDSWRLAHPIDLDPLVSEEGASFQLEFQILKELTGSSAEGAIRKALSQTWPTARPQSWLRDLVRLDPLSVQVQDGADGRYWKVRAAFQVLPSSRAGEVLGELAIPLHPAGMRTPGRSASLMVPLRVRFVPIVEVQPVQGAGLAEDSHLFLLQGLPVEFESATGEAQGWSWSIDPPARFLESPASLRLTRESAGAPRTGRVRIPFQWQGRTLFLHVPIEARAES